MPPQVDQQKLQDALSLMHNLGTVAKEGANGKVSAEHMTLMMQAFEDAGVPPDAIRSIFKGETPKGLPPSMPPPEHKKASTLMSVPVTPKKAHNDEMRAMYFLKLLDDKLRPASNNYDPAEAAQAQIDQMTERLRKNGGRTQVAGAATAADARSMRLRAEQVYRVLSALMRAGGFDPKLLRRKLRASDGNWLLRLHTWLYDEAMPPAMSRLYRTLDVRALTKSELLREDASLVQRYAGGGFEAMRERGLIAKLMAGAGAQLLLHPLTHGVGFAVPSDAALDLIASHAPLVEMGAGTGYWSAVLKHVRGVDVLAYDAAPPAAESMANGFFVHQFLDVRQGDGAQTFATQAGLARERTLLLIWPNNPETAGEETQPSLWDTACLDAYISHGGHQIIYVGERQATLARKAPKALAPSNHRRDGRGDPGDGTVGSAAVTGDSGISSSLAFQQRLLETCECVETLTLPTWKPWHADDLTVWRVKRAAPPPPPPAEPAPPAVPLPTPEEMEVAAIGAGSAANDGESATAAQHGIEAGHGHSAVGSAPGCVARRRERFPIAPMRR